MSFLSSIGWSLRDLEHLPHNTRPARISRVDLTLRHGPLTVLTEDGEQRVRWLRTVGDPPYRQRPGR